jgi:hypothetical protein
MFIIFYFDQILNHPSAYIIIIKNHRKYMKIPFDSKFNFFSSNNILVILLCNQDSKILTCKLSEKTLMSLKVNTKFLIWVRRL